MDSDGVLLKRASVELGSFYGLAGGVTDTGGGATDEGNSMVAAALEPGEHDKAEKVTEVEALSGGVEAAVDLDGAGRNGVIEIGAREGLEEAALLEDVDDVAAARGRGLRLCGVAAAVLGSDREG